jgi:TolB-like protein/Flp pilus assembly protein TadD
MRDAIDTILEASDTGGVGVQAVAQRRWLPRILLAGLVLAALGASAVLVWRRDGGSDTPAPDGLATRIAVLPMVNLSSEPRDQYLADGMTEELISTLSNIGGLHVIARGSVLAYAGTKQSAAEIGRALNVGSLVESTYQKVGTQLRIRVHLVDVATQEERWTEPYDREANVANIFAIQRDISTRVAQALRVHLLPGETQRVAKRPTDNYEAYDLYLRARLLRHDRVNSPAFRTALDTATNMLQEAVALDPSFAAGRAELARVYISRLFQFEPNSSDLHQRAEAEITRALTLDSTLAEAYSARGDLAYTRESGWQLENAMRDYRHALSLKPNFADVHAAFGSLLFHVGLLDDARRELDLTMMLDPANRFVPPRISRVMWYARQYDSALARMERGSGPPVEHALVLGYLGRPAPGIVVLDSLAAAGRVDYDLTAARAVLLARLGRRAEAEAQIKATTAFEPGGSHFHHAEFAIASAYALLGRAAEAELWLERMANDGMPNYALLADDPTLATLRGDPKFQEFLSRERARNERLKAIMHE